MDQTCAECSWRGYFLKVDLDAKDEHSVPWSSIGFLLMNFTEALAVSGLLHPGLSTRDRLENALTAYCLLDVGSMLAKENEKKMGLPKGSAWLHRQTHCNLQELTGLTAIALMGLPGDGPWCPWRQTELPLEQHFGALRRMFN